MTSVINPPSNRRVTAITLAQYAASALQPPPVLRRLFTQPIEMLDLLEGATSEPLHTLLRWSQSKLLGGEHGLKSLDCARMVWGDQRTASLAVCACTMSLYHPDTQFDSYRRFHLAVHQLTVAWAAEAIGRRAGVDSAKAFLVAAVHDIGFLALEKLARPRFVQVLERLDRVTPTTVIERETFNCDHAMVGGELLRQWGAPDDVCEAVQWHHQPLGASDEVRPLASVVSLANYLVTRLGRSSLGVQNVPPPADDAFEQLGLGFRDLSDLVDHLTRTIPEIDSLWL